MWHKKWVFLGVFSWLLVVTSISIANQQTSVEELEQLLQTTICFEASFNQVIFDQQGKTIQKFQGKMAVKKPNLFYWRVEKPGPDLVVVDGKKFWHYDEELEQVTVQNIAEGYKSSPIYVLMSGSSDVDKQYFVTKPKKADCFLASTVCFELIPKVDIEGFQKVRIGFKDGMMNVLRLWDQLGQVSEFEFTNAKQNSKLPKKLFEFVPPPETDMIGAS